MTYWRLQELDDRTFDLFFDGRIVRYHVDSIDEAERLIAQEGGTDYTFEESDGYRTPRQVGR